MNLGIIGLNSREVAESAKRAGYGVGIVTYYSDQDTIDLGNFFSIQSDRFRPNLLTEYSTSALVRLAFEKLYGKVDGILLASGIGCDWRAVEKLERFFVVFGNDSAAVRKAKSWKTLKEKLDRLGIKYPRTEVIESNKELDDIPKKFHFPFVLKLPMYNTVVESHADLQKLKELNFTEALVQAYVPGIPASASILSTGTDAVILSFNRQLLGVKKLNASSELTYCGHFVPLGRGISTEVQEKFKRLVLELGLVGSNGIDFNISGNEVYFMEINPRIQDTIASVERYRGINLVEKHLDCTNGGVKIPESYSNRVNGKCTFFADGNVRVGNLRIAGVHDIPFEGTVIQKNEPVCSFRIDAPSEEAFYRGMNEKSAEIRARCESF